MANRIQLRRGTAANWTSVNPVLAQGEAGFEVDTGQLKIGDGTTAWNTLNYFTGSIPTDLSEFNNDVGFLTSYTETDPTVGSHIKSITTNNVSNWNAAFGWGDHAQAGYALSSSVPNSILDLNIVDGTNGQVLTTDGNGGFSFTTVVGGGSETDPLFTASEAANITSTDTGNWNAAFGWGDHSTQGYLVPTIDTTSATATALANNATANLNLTGGRAYVLYKIQTSHAAWVRVYINDAARTADASRAQGVDPGITSGVVAEAITTGAETVVFAPAINGFNDETPTTAAMPVAVTNLSGTTNNVTVTVTKMTMVA